MTLRFGWILYTRPEIVLTCKATNRRAKDDLDIDATSPTTTVAGGWEPPCQIWCRTIIGLSG
jgi:hypothetical protein